MAGRHTERSKSRCDSVPPIPKRKLAHQIYLRARHFASPGIKTAEQGHDGVLAERVMLPEPKQGATAMVKRRRALSAHDFRSSVMQPPSGVWAEHLFNGLDRQ